MLKSRTTIQSNRPKRKLIGAQQPTRSRKSRANLTEQQNADLVALVWFLNANALTLVESAGSYPIALKFFPPDRAVDDFVQLQREIVDDLAPIADRPADHQPEDIIVNLCLKRLVEKAGSLGIAMSVHFLGYGKIGRAEAAIIPKSQIVRRGGCSWLMEVDSDNLLDFRHYRLVFYDIIREAIWTGSLLKLRRCKEDRCRVFFLARHRGEKFCCRSHTRLHHDGSYQSKLRHRS